MTPTCTLIALGARGRDDELRSEASDHRLELDLPRSALTGRDGASLGRKCRGVLLHVAGGDRVVAFFLALTPALRLRRAVQQERRRAGSVLGDRHHDLRPRDDPDVSRKQAEEPAAREILGAHGSSR